MPFRNFADPDQMSIMTQALDLYCERRAQASKEEREELAAVVIQLFSRGATSVEEIVDGLDRILRGPSRPAHDEQHAP